MEIKSYKDLIVWQRGLEVVFEIYNITSLFPKSETYALSSQMRRAAVSIPSNIAEGRKRRTTKDFLQFLRIASGSVAELETQIIIAKKVYKEINYQVAESKLEEVGKMITIFIRKLEETLLG